MTQTDNAIEAELWAIYLGLKWAYHQGNRKLLLLSDSKQAVEWLNEQHVILGDCGTLIKWCKDWLEKDWSVIVEHIPREENAAADWLAREAPRRLCDWIDLHHPPKEVRDILCANIETFVSANVSH
ncbi:PREDICTED: uncharacterized protein LOC109174424 [Ipomoea nil]|uniref:uncharacterized protein LOC109174424 n=1 Tax=Ipomoea nil TaxID=35883 RepID=UPI000900C4A3|nr:PREDICTED: uncharacterized protein LOC109174424 [Ipomoea nil]